MKTDIYAKVTNLILNQLRQGVIPWRKSWKTFYPQNFVSKNGYQGINFILLSMLDFASPFFLTFNQAKKLGGNVLKGSTGQPIVFWKIINGFKEDANGDIKNSHAPFIKNSTVFNLTQTDLYKEEEPQQLEVRPNAEELLNSLSFIPEIKHGKNRAYYSPTLDFISVPPQKDFDGVDEYYSTLFHEVIHSTGHASRKDRFKPDQYKGDENYSFEELVAEIGSAFLCSMCGIDNTLQNSASYIKGWLSHLQDNQKLIIKASTQAKNAVNFLLNKTEEKKEEKAA
jgi:antirestriction protein ArdC